MIVQCCDFDAACISTAVCLSDISELHKLNETLSFVPYGVYWLSPLLHVDKYLGHVGRYNGAHALLFGYFRPSGLGFCSLSTTIKPIQCYTYEPDSVVIRHLRFRVATKGLLRRVSVTLDYTWYKRYQVLPEFCTTQEILSSLLYFWIVHDHVSFGDM